MNNIAIDPMPAGTSERSRYGFILTVIFLIFDYGRPMDQMPFLSYLRPEAVISVLLIFAIAADRGYAQVRSRQTTWIFLFISLLAAHVPLAQNMHFAFNRTVGMLKYLPFLAGIVIYVNSVERLKRFLNIWIILTFYLAVRGIFHKGNAASAFLKDENDFAMFMDIMVPFCFFLFMYEKSKAKKMFYLLTIAAAVASIVVSFSRGGFVGLLAVGIFIWLFSPKKILSLLIIGVLALSVSHFAGAKYATRIDTIKQTNQGTAEERIESWKAAWAMFKDNPLGVGGSNFEILFPLYQPRKMHHSMWGREAHSLWMTLLAELGIPGVIVYAFLFLANLRDIKKLKKLTGRGNKDPGLRFIHYLALAFAGSLIGYFVPATFISVLYYPHYFYITALIIATMKILHEKLSDAQEEPAGELSPEDVPEFSF